MGRDSQKTWHVTKVFSSMETMQIFYATLLFGHKMMRRGHQFYSYPLLWHDYQAFVFENWNTGCYIYFCLDSSSFFFFFLKSSVGL